MTDWERRRQAWRAKRLGRAALAAASLAWGLAMFLRRWLYERGLLRSKTLPARVLCIGNLTTGGTGKTPAVLLAAQTLRRRGVPVAILSRGYGRTGQAKRVTALVDGKPAAWSECGDEPWLLQRCLAGQGVPILVSSDRFRAGERAVRAHGARVLILDDGFQHLRLRRDLDVVLLNALDPFGGGAVLPLGRLREPPSALRRAGLIVLTHADAVTPDKLRKLEERVRRRNPTAPILRAVHRPDALLTARGGELRPPSSLKGQRLASLCGLAEPAAFETLLERLGAVIEQRWRFPDHHPYTDKDLRSVARLGDGLPVVTTAKDLARLPSGWESSLPCELLVLTIRLEFIEGGEAWERALLRLAEAP